MSRFDNIGLFWQDLPSSRKRGERVLGPIPDIPETGWRPPTSFPDLRGERVIALDTETYDPELNDYGPGWARDKGHMCGFSVAVPGRSWYFPMRHEVQKEYNMDPDACLRWAKDMLETPKIDKVGANLIYDIGWFKHEGIDVQGTLHDVQFAEALLDETSKVALEALGQRHCGIGKESDILKEWCVNYYGGSEAKWRRNIYRAPVTLCGRYGEQDAALPLEVMHKQWPLLAQQGLLDLYRMECDLIPLLVQMRYAGVSVDIPYAEKLRDEFETDEKRIQKLIDEQAGFAVNTNSADDLSRAFRQMGLTHPMTKPTTNNPDGKPSFVKEFLEQHPHKFPQLITEMRGVAKLRGTFVEGYLLNSHVNGKVHGSFTPLTGTDGGAKTGRFASKNPNLQNIPTRTADGKKIRRAFIVDPGHVEWRKYDYSQIEYRLLAHFATGPGADAIRDAYNNDPRTDYHQATIELIHSVTGIMLERGQAKNINFGIAYGMGIVKLAKDLGVSIKQAKELLTAYHKGVPFAKPTMKAMSEFADMHGFNQTILNRRTRFNTWEPADFRDKRRPLPLKQALEKYGSNIQRAYLYRTLNYTLQGSSADMMKAAMLKCYVDGVFDVTGIPRLTVHDELDFSVAERTPIVEEGFREMRHIMQTVIPLRVPVICDLEIGPNWGDVKEAA